MRTKKIHAGESIELDDLVFRTTETVVRQDFLAGGTLRAEAVGAAGGCQVDIVHCLVPQGDSSTRTGLLEGFTNSIFRVDVLPEVAAPGWEIAGPDVEVVAEQLTDLDLPTSCGQAFAENPFLCTNESGLVVKTALPMTDTVGMGVQKRASVSEVEDADLRAAVLSNARVACGLDRLCIGDPGWPGPDAAEQEVAHTFPYSFSFPEP